MECVKEIKLGMKLSFLKCFYFESIFKHFALIQTSLETRFDSNLVLKLSIFAGFFYHQCRINTKFMDSNSTV